MHDGTWMARCDNNTKKCHVIRTMFGHNTTHINFPFARSHESKYVEIVGGAEI